MKQTNIRSILVEASKNNCYDANKIIDAVHKAKELGYKGISDLWVKKVENWSRLSESTMGSIVTGAFNGEKGWVNIPLVDVDDEIKSIFMSVSEPVPSVPSAPSAPVKTRKVKPDINLRTILQYCYDNQVFSSSAIINALKAMKADGLSVADEDIEFASGWRSYNEKGIKKMATDVNAGESGFCKRPLLTLPTSISKYFPITINKANASEINLRSVLNKMFESNKYDGVLISATLDNLIDAGYTGIEKNHSFATLSSDAVVKLVSEAHNGEGEFKSVPLINY